MAKHRLDHGQPLFPDPFGEDTDITDETERYAHFEREAVEAKNALRKVRNLKLLSLLNLELLVNLDSMLWVHMWFLKCLEVEREDSSHLQEKIR